MYTPKSVEEIIAAYRSRQLERGVFFEQCKVISQHYNNQITLPLPEIDRTEAPAVANLLKQGVDQHAMRVASVLPDVQAPPVKPGDNASEKRADQRRRAAIGFWENNRYDLLMRQRARWLGAFAQAPVLLYPDRATRMPRWQVRSPLETYPAATGVGESQPDDCIFAGTHTIRWVKNTYPDIPVQLIRTVASRYIPANPLNDDDRVEVIEYRDENELVVLIYGPGDCDLAQEAEYGINDARIINLTPPDVPSNRMWGTEVLRVPNRLGETPVCVPGRISLDALRGQFDDMPGLARMQAKLAAMEINAIANGIWPDQWIVGVDGRNPRIITPADGRKGVVGEIQDGTIVTTQTQPGVQTPQAIDRLERAQRLNGGIPADFSGESASNIRTARRGDAVLGEAVDYTIQEHQQILAASAQTELQIAANIDKTYFGNDKKSFYISWKGGKGRLDYTPNTIWGEDKTLRVSYAKAGADINMLDVQIGQLTSMEIMSKLTGARMHPDIRDPEFEHDQINYEQLETAARAAILQMASQGALPVSDVARIAQLVRQDKMDLFAAIQQAQTEAQQRQASTVSPAEPGSPEAQPGLAPPGAGAEAGTTIGPPSPSMDNLTQILRGLRTQQQVANS